MFLTVEIKPLARVPVITPILGCRVAISAAFGEA